MTQTGAQAVTVVDFGTCPSPGRTVFHQLDAPAMYGVDHDLHVVLTNAGRVAVPLAGWQVFFNAPQRGIVAFTCDPAMQLGPGQDRVLALGHRWGSTQVPLPFGIDPSDCDLSQLEPIHRGVRSLPGAVALFDPRARGYGVTVMDGGGDQDLEALMTAVETHHPGASLQGPPRFVYSFDALVSRRLAQGAFPRGSWAHDWPGGAQGYVYDPEDDPAPTDAGFDPDVTGPAAGGMMVAFGTKRQAVTTPHKEQITRPDDLTEPQDMGSLVGSEQTIPHPHMPLRLIYRCQGQEGWPERALTQNALTQSALEQIALHMGDLGPDLWPDKAAERTKQVSEPYLRQILRQSDPFQWQRGGAAGQMQGGFGLRAQDGTTHQFILQDGRAALPRTISPKEVGPERGRPEMGHMTTPKQGLRAPPQMPSDADQAHARVLAHSSGALDMPPAQTPRAKDQPAVQDRTGGCADPGKDITQDVRCAMRNGRMTYRFIPPADSATPARALPGPVLAAVLDWFMAHPASVWEQFPTPVVQADLQAALLGTPVKSAQAEVLISLIGQVDDGVFSVMAGDGGAHHFSVSARAMDAK